MRVVSDPLNGQWQSSLYFRNTAEWDNPSSPEFLVGCESSWEMGLTRNEMEQLEVCSNLFSQDLWEILGPAIHRALSDILPDKSQVNLSFLLFKDKMIRVSSLGQCEITKKTNQIKQIKANQKSQWANAKTPWWGFCWPQRESQFTLLSSLTYLVAKITSDLLNSKSFHSRTGFGWGLRALRWILGLIML